MPNNGFVIHDTENLNKFIDDCSSLKVKPVFIQTENINQFENQIMTSSKYRGDNYTEILKDLSSKGRILYLGV